jgi:hypothetical protein
MLNPKVNGSVFIFTSSFLLLTSAFSLLTSAFSILHNRRKRLRVQARAANQRAINFFL